MKLHKSGQVICLGLVGLTYNCSPLLAQSNANPADTSSPASSAPTSTSPQKASTTTSAPATAAKSTTSSGTAKPTLDTIVVTGASLDDSILSTVRPVNSIYGTDLNVLDTPRSVTTVTREQMEEAGFRNFNDLRQFSSGISTNDGYGLEAVPIIRGEATDIYQNGVRRSANINRYPFNFNSVDSLDVVKGAATSVYGPGFYTGGYVNLVTKQPFFDKNHTEINTTLGSWVEGGGSYNNFTWQLDNGGPLIKDKLAYRVSYQQREADSYYRNVVDNETDVYAALTYLPYESLSFNFNGEFETAKYNENLGLNRPTQALIDNNSYTAGPANGAGSGGFGYIVPSVTAYQQKIYGYDTLVSPDAQGQSQMYNLQLTTTFTGEDDFTIVNHSFFQSTKFHQYEPYIFTTDVPYDTLLDNRTEINTKFKTPFLGIDMEHSTTSGIDIRYEEVREYASVLFQVINGYDLTQSPSSFNFGAFDPLTTLPIPGFEQIIPNSSGHLAEVGTVDGSTSQSTELTVGAFHQHTIKFNDQWSLLFGGRFNADFSHISDPLPPTGTEPVADNLTTGSYSVNGSLTYKPVDWCTTYVTYNKTQAVNKSALGGLQLENGTLAASDFHVVSSLYEGGAKFQLIPDVWFAGVAGYYQRRFQANIVGPPSEIEVRGVEVDTAYQPNKNFSVTSNFTWREANYIQCNPNIAASPVGFATDQPLDDFNSFIGAPIGNYRLPGFPNILFNLYATYQFDNGFGVSVGPQVESSQNLGIVNPVTVPAQYTWNGTIFYHQKNYEVNIDFLNFTDERNFEPLDTGFSSGDLVSESVPFHVQGRIKIRF